MNIIDYIDWRGDITFGERDLNEVDNLIFSTLTYLKMDGLIPEQGISIRAMYELCVEDGIQNTGLLNDPLPLLKKAACSARFGNVIISDYVNTVDTDRQIQFAAAAYRYSPGKTYIAFRGTDNTIVGWREDMNFSLLGNTPGQLLAAEYIDTLAGKSGDSIIVGGHSKGGNFAVYGAAFCGEKAKAGISKVYSNDGPGFNRGLVSTDEYASVIDRVEKIIPESSLVGILLSSKARRKVITSSGKGIMQHDPFTWNVVGTRFAEADERSAASVFMDDTLNSWVATLSEENLRVLVNTVFGTLESTGALTLTELNDNKWKAYNAILKAMARIDPDSRNEVFAIFLKLLSSGKDTVVSETRKLIEKYFPAEKAIE